MREKGMFHFLFEQWSEAIRMLVGNFLCTQCAGRRKSSEMLICSHCHSVICSTCQIYPCEKSFSEGHTHDVKRFDDVLREMRKIAENKGDGDMNSHAKRVPSGVRRNLHAHVRNLAVCNKAIREALETQKIRKRKMEEEMTKAIRQIITVFVKMMHNQERLLRQRLNGLFNERSIQLNAMLENTAVLSDLTKQLYEGENERYHSDTDYDLLHLWSKLDVMKLMLSFGNATNGRLKFKTLSENDMRKALHTLPEIGRIQVELDQTREHKNSDSRFLSEGALAELSSEVGLRSAELPEMDEVSSKEDSIGETDRDFGEYHIGKTLMKIDPEKRQRSSYVPNYNIVSQDVTVQDEMVLPVIKKNLEPGKRSFLHRIPVAVKNNLIPSRPLSPKKNKKENDKKPTEGNLKSSAKATPIKAIHIENDTEWTNEVGVYTGEKPNRASSGFHAVAPAPTTSNTKQSYSRKSRERKRPEATIRNNRNLKAKDHTERDHRKSKKENDAIQSQNLALTHTFVPEVPTDYQRAPQSRWSNRVPENFSAREFWGFKTTEL